MTTVQEIKAAIQKLSPKEQAELDYWLQHRSDDEWDRQMIRDIDAGKLDTIIAQAGEDIRSGNLQDGP